MWEVTEGRSFQKEVTGGTRLPGVSGRRGRERAGVLVVPEGAGGAFKGNRDAESSALSRAHACALQGFEQGGGFRFAKV